MCLITCHYTHTHTSHTLYVFVDKSKKQREDYSGIYGGPGGPLRIYFTKRYHSKNSMGNS